jgi:HEAT repeat protein
MNGAACRTLIAALADAVAEPDPVRFARVTEQLTGLDGPGWLRLDEMARRPSWKYSPLDSVADWRPLLAADGAPAGVFAASMSRDGRIRETAVTVLAGLPLPAAAAALAVRVSDWVPQVSSAAWAAVSGRTGPEDAAAVVPVFLALRQRARGRQEAASYLGSLTAGPPDTLAVLATAPSRACRLWALQAQAERGLLPAEVLADRAMRDPDPVVALWCAHALAGPAQVLPATGLRLLESARAGVRAFATGHLSDEQLPRTAVRELLLDRSGAVRSMARWRWEERWGTPAPVYLSVLANTAPARHIEAALHGLDEDHDQSLPEIAVPFLAHTSPRVRRAAAQAVARHASEDSVVSYLVPLLLDNSGRVTAVALRYLHGCALRAGVLASLDHTGTQRSQRIALSIRQHSGTWNRVHADLTAVNGPDPALAEAGRTDLLAWLQHGAATSYGAPTAAQAADIAALLATPLLTDRQRREIAFVAGIR